MARTADKTDIPRRLTAAGHELFTRCGYHATGIQQITDQAGVPKGSFYNHFESKEAFAAAIIQHYAQWVDESWERCRSDAPPGAHEAVRHVFTRFIAHHEQQGCQGCLVGNFAAEVAETSALCCGVLNTALAGWRSNSAWPSCCAAPRPRAACAPTSMPTPWPPSSGMPGRGRCCA